MLVSKHFCDMISNTVDLTALSRQDWEIMKWRIPFDLLSTMLIIAVQVKLYKTNTQEVTSTIAQEKVRLWIVMEIALFYLGLVV